MQTNLFIVVLTYIESLERIEAYREKHLQYLDHYYQKKIFITSGPQVPRTGGIIIARSTNKLDLEKILKKDPFSIHRLAEYRIYEFTPTEYSASFQALLEKIEPQHL